MGDICDIKTGNFVLEWLQSGNFVLEWLYPLAWCCGQVGVIYLGFRFMAVGPQVTISCWFGVEIRGHEMEKSFSTKNLLGKKRYGERSCKS